MQTYNFDGKGVTVTYMDSPCFIFDPCVIIVDGAADTLSVRVTVKYGDKTATAKGVPYGNRTVLDLRQYLRSMFDAADLTLDGKTAKTVSITVAVFNPSALAFSFDTVAVWGTKRVGDIYAVTVATPQVVQAWSGYPFTYDLFSVSAVTNTISFVSDNVTTPVSLEAGLNRLAPPLNDGNVTLWRRTTSRARPLVTFLVDTSGTSGVYLRWMNHLGMWCYYLFTPGDLAAKVTVSNVRRNNMVDASGQGWDSVPAVRQQSTRTDTLALCAPSVDSATFDFLADILTSPVVERYVQESDGWAAVSPVSATLTKEGRALQDFTFSIQEERTTLTI